MEKSKISISENEVKSPVDHELQELTKNATREKGFDGLDLYFHKDGFWCPGLQFKAVASFQDHFQARDTDIVLATPLQSGTTWLKALTFTIINRAKYSPNTQDINPLLTTNPHNLILNIEYQFYMKDRSPDLDHLPSPRLLHTHVPFSGLPKSILDSKCRIVLICRNPVDHFVSHWHFWLKRFKREHEDDDSIKMPCIDEAFELFCRGVHPFGPFWDNTLGFWKASLENPERILFLTYEDLKDDISNQVKKIAEFLGFGFSMEEEKQGVIEEIANICSFENLKSLQVNKEGEIAEFVMNSTFFRVGQAGDWVNTISPSQAKRLEDITKEKLDGSGFMFKTFCN